MSQHEIKQPIKEPKPYHHIKWGTLIWFIIISTIVVIIACQLK